MIEHLTMALAGFVVALVCADTLLTRDAIKRSGGKIIEGNKLMVWFMSKDWRAAIITVAVSSLTVLSSHVLVSIGAWYGAVGLCSAAVYIRGKVVFHNYRLNVKVM